MLCPYGKELLDGKNPHTSLSVYFNRFAILVRWLSQSAFQHISN